jgi:rhodanese-related sulfurtransferase
MSEIPRLAPAEVARRMRSHDALLVCAYDSPVSFPKFPLPGAIPLERLRALEEQLERERQLVFYCRCPGDRTALARAREYGERGFEHCAVLAGGFEAWNGR